MLIEPMVLRTSREVKNKNNIESTHRFMTREMEEQSLNA